LRTFHTNPRLPLRRTRSHPIGDRRRKARRTSEAAFALPSAIIVLFMLTLLTGAAISVASQSSTSTTRDDNVKAEVEAAEAGLHVADYRLAQLKPAETQCISEGEAVTAKSKGEAESNCKDGSESLGNNATFKYWTSLPLKAGETCAGRTVKSEEGITQRCVTSEGKVNGAEPAVRLQARTAASSGTALFSIHGVLGLKKVVVNGSANVPGVVASNGEIRGEGSANFERGFEICAPEGKFKPPAGERKGVKVASKETDPELEKTRPAGECPIKAPLPAGHPTAESNEDARIGVSDKLEGGGYTWTPAKFELNMEGTAKLTLGESGKTTKYFFCSFKMPGGGPEWKIAAGAKVEIFIGNSEETKSCAAGTGKFEIAGGSKTANESKNPGALLIEIGGKGPFTFANGSGKTLEASIYAPNAQVHMEGGVKFAGAIVGEEVFLENGTKYEWSEESGKLGGTGGAASYTRKAWEQCVKGSGASEGC
jgi:Tfp pilus assembly protein PilX